MTQSSVVLKWPLKEAPKLPALSFHLLISMDLSIHEVSWENTEQKREKAKIQDPFTLHGILLN